MIKRKLTGLVLGMIAGLMINGTCVCATEIQSVSDNQVVGTPSEETNLDDKVKIMKTATEDLDEETTDENTGETTDEATDETTDETADAMEHTVEGFVTRLYNVCLDREPDEHGFNDWVSRLNNKEETGIHAAYGFIFSTEFQNKNLCNEDYVEYLYRAFMGRESDEAGKADWLNRLKTGKTREEVFNGFALSKEFSVLCEEYGIDVGEGISIPQYGTVPGDKCVICGKPDGVTAFVTRLYQVCLDREPDEPGLNDWCSKLRTHTATGAEVSYGFIFSPEFQNRNFDDEEFVEYLYKAFFDRPSDPQGKSNWLMEMYYGMNRSHVFAGFVGSKEFANLCAQYSITVGTYTPVNDPLTPETVGRMSYGARQRIIMGEYYGQRTLSKAQADSLMTTITVPVWDFLNTRSLTKVAKTAKLTCNKYVADYFKMAFEELFNHPAQPVIHPGSFYAYSYRANVNNPSVLSNHSYGTAIDINPGENPNGKPLVTAAAWAAMPQGSVYEMQKKAYTIYEGSPYYQVLYEKYHLYWLGYNRTVDAMHFEF